MIAKKYEKEVFFIDNQDTCSVSSNTKLNKLGIKLNKLNISKELSKLSFFNF